MHMAREGRVQSARVVCAQGPKRLRGTDPDLVEALDRLVDPDTRGDPDSPLRWTTKSTRQLAEALTAQGHPVSDDTVGRLLKQQGYRLQRTVKTLEGAGTKTGMLSSATSTSRPASTWPLPSRW
jgi:hypothetical protein